MNSPWLVAVAVGLTLAGCAEDRRMRLAPPGDASSGDVDAAVSSDGGAPGDSGEPPDADGFDAATDDDASVDADAGGVVLPDAGPGVDAGTPALDAGSPPRPDAGPPRVDAGAGSIVPDGAGQIVISELMINPALLADTAGEWIELYNPSTLVTYDLAGCVLGDLGVDAHTIGASLRVAPRSFVTLARAATPGFTPNYVYSAFNLANATDEVVLSCGGTTIDQVVYDTAFGWSVPTGASLSLSPASLDATSNDSPTSWCAATTAYGSGDLGTPGAPNGC